MTEIEVPITALFKGETAYEGDLLYYFVNERGNLIISLAYDKQLANCVAFSECKDGDEVRITPRLGEVKGG